MSRDPRRISLIARGANAPHRDWDDSRAASSRMVFVDSFAVLRHALRGGVTEMSLDIERVVIDRAATSDDFLAMLATLPHEYHGDVVFIRDDEFAFLSATGRGGDRVLYSMSAQDIRFYLETHGLVTGRVVLARPAA